MIRRFRQALLKSPKRSALLIVSVIGLLGCGPDLTDPGTGDVTGRWFSVGSANGITNITLTLAQEPDGSLSGSYTATAAPELGFCNTNAPCPIGNTIAGANTAFQIFFDLLGGGHFTGQLTGAAEMKGAMTWTDIPAPIVFSKL
jgi:hypothetical protein